MYAVVTSAQPLRPAPSPVAISSRPATGRLAGPVRRMLVVLIVSAVISALTLLLLGRLVGVLGPDDGAATDVRAAWEWMILGVLVLAPSLVLGVVMAIPRRSGVR